MYCPECQFLRSLILNTYETDGGTVTRRRRQCRLCEHRWSTLEQVCPDPDQEQPADAEPPDWRERPRTRDSTLLRRLTELNAEKQT